MSEKQATAGSNEKRFKEIWSKCERRVVLEGKQRFSNLKPKDKPESSKKVEISVDESFEFEGTDYLIEIDSGNMAKLLVGQYVLLNELRGLGKNPAFFIVVHAYKNYNTTRTVKNLDYINKKIFGGKGIPFGVMHIDGLKEWHGGIPELHKLLEKPAAKKCLKVN